MKNIFACLLLFSFTLLNAQQRKTDSLENLLKADKEDTNKVNHLINFGYQKSIVGDLTTDSACIWQAIKLGQRLGYNTGIAFAYQSMGIYYDEKSDYNSAISSYNNALKMCDGTGNKNRTVAVLSSLGAVYYEMGNFTKSLEYDERALKLAREIGNKSFEASTLGTMASVYQAEGNFPAALDFDMKTLRISDSIGNITISSGSLLNIGNIYEDMGNHDSALKYNMDALKKLEAMGDKIDGATALMNIGSIYSNQKKYSDAIIYELKALQMFKEIGSNEGLANSYGNLGDYYEAMGETSKAFTNDSTAIKMCEKIGDVQGLSTYSNSLASIYIDRKDYKNAEKYLLKADSLAQNIKAFNLIKVVDKNLADLYTKTGEWQKSNRFLQKYADAKDTLFNQDKSKQVGRLEAKYSYDKQLAVQQAEADNARALADAESKRQRIFLLLIAAIALSVILIAVLIYRSLQSAKKEKFLVERQKSIMELKALRAQMNPHFIFNVINSIQHFILKHDSEAAEEHLSEFSRLIRKVLENSRHETIALSEEIKMLELYLKLESMRFSSKFNYTISTGNSLDAENVFIPPLIVQPYVENAIWHGLMHLKDKQGEISIKFDKSDSSLKCTIDDNGIGRKRSMEMKKGAPHESLGLSITKERLQIINMLYQAKMSVKIIDRVTEDGTGLGTTVELLIPANFNLTAHA
jgi:tetratricopeptide (TPR) repeat protein